MRKARIVAIWLFAIWLGFGPATSALAQSAETPCESMAMSTPADDCCGGGMDQASCLSACLAASPALAASAADVASRLSGHAPVVAAAVRRASMLAPPDIAPPKSFVS